MKLVNVVENTTLYAQYTKSEIGLKVGEGKEYETIKDALDACKDGDTIIVYPGNYTSVEINKSVTLKGSNYKKNLFLTNDSEKVTFTGDIIISADNVEINGIFLSEKGRVINKASLSLSNITLKNIVVSNSTLNPTSADSVTAPFHFAATGTNSISNIVVDSCRMDKVSGRPMILYLTQVNGLKVTNSEFYGGGFTNYNDGIKVDNTANYGIKGEVLISGNVFKNYGQYVIWFRSYMEGKYTIENNIFETIGQNTETHAAVTFVASKVENNQELEVNVNHNKITTGCILFRIDKSGITLTPTNTKINVNYNSMDNCSGIYYIKNQMDTVVVNANNNYFGVTTIDTSKILNATCENYYTKIEDVPSIGSQEGLKYQINYDLNGGSWMLQELVMMRLLLIY